MKTSRLSRSINTTHPILAAGILSAATLFTASTTQAVSITWGAAQNISGDSNVSLNGTLVNAFNIGPSGVPSTTINGVTFASFGYPTASTPSYTQGDYKVEVDFTNVGSANLGSGAAPFTALSAAYQALLGSGGGGGLGSTYTLTMSGLTLGTIYEFQWWSNDSSSGANGTTATAGNAVTLDSNLANSSGSVGQFAIGTFTADNAAQQIAFTRVAGASISIVNGFQLRQLSYSTGVPDSGSTLALFGLALTGLALVGRKSVSR